MKRFLVRKGEGKRERENVSLFFLSLSFVTGYLLGRAMGGFYFLALFFVGVWGLGFC